MNLADKLTRRLSYDQYFGRVKIMLGRPATRVYGLAILTILTVIFFLSFAILPTFKTIASLKREIADAKNTEAKLQQKLHSLNQAEALYSQITPDLESLNQVLPAEPQMERLAWQLHWLAKQDQVTLVNGSFSEFAADHVPVSLSLKGRYPAIKAFIADLNRYDRLIDIDEITIASKNVRAAGDPLTANLKLKAFY